ncbi:MAG TPA: DinB family protein [Blastocatellia bacterium]|nr:DinB family protein [Blastocatellia bacterium]
MKLSELLLPEFDNEMKSTRKTLERVPDGKFDWKPHDKSMPLGNLANHLATIPMWAVTTVERDSLNLNPPNGEQISLPKGTTTAELVAIFDRESAAARAAIAQVSDEELMKPWTLLSGEHKIFTLPKVSVLRGFVMNHLIHHRAQLGVYLRLNDIPVPSVYGPSADENTF